MAVAAPAAAHRRPPAPHHRSLVAAFLASGASRCWAAPCPNPRANDTSLNAKRAARIIRLHIANDVYQSLGNPFSAGHSNPDVSICSPSLTMEKIVEASRKLSENLNWHTWVTSWNSPPGNLCHESTGLGNFVANPRVKLLPNAKGRPLDTSGLSRRTPRAKVDPSSSTQIRQGAQYVASVTEESVLAPSPTSAGAAHSQTDPLGRCSFNNPPLPTMFDAQVHESSQITQLETYVLLRHEVSLWRDLSACTPVCPSGHALNRIQLVDFFDILQPSTTCCCCSSSISVNSLAFTCFRCVADYFLTLPTDKEIVSSGLSKGALYCTNCAHRTDADRSLVQSAPAPPRN